jgi:hypothetical protein
MPLAWSCGLIMVTPQHEASHRIFQGGPELMSSVFGVLGMPLSKKTVVEVLSPDVTEIRPVERRIDSLLRVSQGEDGKDTFMLAIEAQMRPDKDKAVSWAYYLSYLKSKYGCPALLLVICQDKATAEWARGPLHLGRGDWNALTVRPLVVSPLNIPVIADATIAARNLALAAFSAMTHARREDIRTILVALATAMTELDEKTVDYYSEILEVGLGNAQARSIWRELLRSPIFFPGRGTLREEWVLEAKAEGKAEGRAEGKAEGLVEGLQKGIEQGRQEGLQQGLESARLADQRHLIDVLQNRDVKVSGEACARIMACMDVPTLERWIKRAWKVDAAEDIFVDDED